MASEIDRHLLCRKWAHSHEEDTAAEMVYRPADHAFPPSRGRKSMELGPDGTFVETGPGSTDRRTSKTGSWRIEGNRLITNMPDEDSERSRTINSLEPDRLVLEKHK